MRANTPHQLPHVFQEHFNAGDVPGLMDSYYATNATYAPVPGVVVSGTDVEPTIARLVTLGAPIDVAVRHVLETGDTALIVLDWTIERAGLSGTATDVAERQPDGSWRCIIDNPHGGAHTVDAPAETVAALGA